MRAVPESQQEAPALEQALAQLRPTAPALNRDALMFAAGRASVPAPSRAWQGTSLLLACALVVSLMQRPRHAAPGSEALRGGRQGHQQAIATVDPPPPLPGWSALAGPPDGSYIHLRNAVLTRGLDALPEPSAPPLDQPTWTNRQEWIESMLSS